MVEKGRWLYFDGVDTHADEFTLLWIGATTTYGVGDVVTTIALHHYAPRVVEGNVLVTLAMGNLGLAGLIGLKLLVFFGMLAISLISIVRWKERDLYLFPPLVLTVVGAVVTTSNLWLLAR